MVADVTIDGQPIAVQPVSIAYAQLDGIPMGRLIRPYFAWYGDMILASHLWRMAGLGTVTVAVHFHPPTTVVACGSRKALAQVAQNAVARGVAAQLTGRPIEPPGLAEPARASVGAPA